MNLTQIEARDAYRDPLPLDATHDRMARLYDDRRRELRIINNKQNLLATFDKQWPQIKTQPIRDMRGEIVSQIAAAESRLRRVLDEIADGARLIAAEDAAREILCSDCGNYPPDWPSRLCIGCASYQEHTTV